MEPLCHGMLQETKNKKKQNKTKQNKKTNNQTKTKTNQVEESSYEYEENSEVSDYEDDMYLHPVYAVDENTSKQKMDDKWYEYVEVQEKKVRMQLVQNDAHYRTACIKA